MHPLRPGDLVPPRELAERAAELDQAAPSIDELASADAAFAAARTLIEHFTADCPVVVVLDDVHWAVPTFLDVVEYLVRAAHGPLLVISMARPSCSSTVPPGGGSVDARLAGRSRRSPSRGCAARTRRARRQAGDGDPRVGEGVPLFLEQLAAHAAEAGFAADGIPSTLDALLASRIDALEPGERDVLSRAAVVGRAFSQDSVRALTPEEESRELDGRLASLARRRLVRPRATEHEFVHPLIHRAAYGAIDRVGVPGCTRASPDGSTRAAKAMSWSAPIWSALRSTVSEGQNASH